MALVVKDRVKQTTTTTGTGSIVLNGNVSGFQTFAAALTDGDTTYYGIFEPSTNEYEVGLGTWTESTSTLARTTVLESSNSGSAVSLTAQAEVFITQPAEKAVYQDSNGDVDLGGNKILFGNLYSTTGDLPSASTYHGMFAHVHGTGKAYYAHAGNWIELVNEDTSGNVSMGGNLTVTGDLTVNGTTTTIDTTNTVVTDSLIELANGTTGTPANDAGLVIERGDSNNAFIGFDESADKFIVGTGSFTGASTGDLTITTGTLVANVEGNVTGNVTGNAATATALATGRTISLTGAVTGTSAAFDGSGNVSIATTATSDPTLTLAGDASGSATFTNLGNATLTVTVADDSHNHVISNIDGLQSALDGKQAAGNYFTDGDTVLNMANNDGFTYNDTTNVMYVKLDGTDYQLWHTGNDGSGSGLDADTVDGLQASSFLRSDASDTFTSISGTTVTADNVYLAGTLYHEGDTDTHLSFGTDLLALTTGGTARVYVSNTGVQLGDTGNGYFQPVTGSYGSIQIDGGAHGGYEGYNIGGIAVFMTDSTSSMGLYNDANNQWVVRGTLNGTSELYYAGNTKLDTSSTGVNITGDINAVDNVYVAGNIYHEGDTDTSIGMETDAIRLKTGGADFYFDGQGLFITSGSLAEVYNGLSGTTPTCNVDNAGAFSLTMTGNTTFTFSGPNNGYSQGFILQLTGNGGTVTWPTSVDWAGGTAPAAPASGETDIYVFWTRDGGTTWYGALSIDAAA